MAPRIGEGRKRGETPSGIQCKRKERVKPCMYVSVDEVWDAFIRTCPRERGSYDGMGEGDHLSREI